MCNWAVQRQNIFLLSWHKISSWLISCLLCFKRHNLATKAQPWMPRGHQISRAGTCTYHSPNGKKWVSVFPILSSSPVSNHNEGLIYTKVEYYTHLLLSLSCISCPLEILGCPIDRRKLLRIKICQKKREAKSRYTNSLFIFHLIMNCYKS